MMNKILVYIDSLFKGRLPFRYKGIYIIDESWVIHYSCLSVNQIDMSSFIGNCIQQKFTPYLDRFKFESYGQDLVELYQKSLQAFLGLDAIFEDENIFFTQFKLQRYSEYKSERRDLLIKNLLNEKRT